MFKVIIAGSRSFNDYEKLKDFCDKVLINQTEIEVVSGNAAGADRLGERYAKEKGHSLKIFKADWDKYNKKAGVLRNQEMANYADALIAFWDGKSKGTEDMIKKAKKQNKKVRISA
jgi:predicted Rossmann fold nucleotide-binding protein DprA/Smf involved in DNA uptake